MLRRSFLIGGRSLAASWPLRAQQREAAVPLVLGTATPGGSFPASAALVAAIHEVDADLAIEQRNTKGSSENLTLLNKSRLDLALVQGRQSDPRNLASMVPATWLHPATAAYRTAMDSSARWGGAFVEHTAACRRPDSA